MIRLSGPEGAPGGKRVCVTAANAATGFSVVVQVGRSEIQSTVTIDPKTHEATICFVMPPADQGGVTVHASNAGGPRDSLVIISL